MGTQQEGQVNFRGRHRPSKVQRVGEDGAALVMMVLDVIEEAAGRYHIWGKTDEGRSVLCRVNDFAPYFYIAAPVHAASS